MIISRLMPNKDLKEGLKSIIIKKGIKSGIIITIVGSLNYATLRMSDGNIKVFNGPFEIVSAEGTISENGIHIHIAISDSKGQVVGGHLKKGCVINTTAEIGILELDETLKRVFDSKTGYKELLK
jgi:predicted DNA-binding protein with PD1-like motif